MFNIIKKRFPEGKLQLRFGDKNNPIINHKGDIIEDFRDGDYGGMVVNKNGDGLVLINTGVGNNNTAATLIHEAIGHYGPDILLSSDKKLKSSVDKLYNRDKNSQLVKDLKKQYFPDEIKDEWFARVIENNITEVFNEDGSIDQDKLNALDSDTRTIIQKIKDFFKRLFRGKPTKQEINKVVFDVFKKTPSITKSDTKKSVLLTKKQKIAPKEKIIKKAEKTTEKRKKTKKHLNTFVKDLVKAQTSTDKNKAIVRYTAFAERNLTMSQKGQLLAVINKIKKADNTDVNYKKVNDLINEFHHYRAVAQLEKDFLGVDKKKDITSKDRKLKESRESITKSFDDLTDFETLKRLFDRGFVRRPFLKGTKKLSKMGEKYARVSEQKFIDNDIEKGGETFYHINEQGKTQLGILKKSNEKVLETLDNDILEYKIAVQELKDEIAGKKKAEKEKLEKAVDDGIESVDKFLSRKIIKNAEVRKKVAFLSTTGEHSAIRIDGFTNTDKNGLQQGAINENIIKVGEKGDNEKKAYKQNSQQFIMNEIALGEKREGVKVDNSTFSEVTHYGVIDRTSDLVRKIPLFKKALDNKIGRGRVKKFVYKFKDGSVQLNKAQRVSMYLYSLNNDARRHITEGGIKLKKDERPTKLTQTELEQVANDVRASKDEMIVANAIYKFFNEVQNIEINKVSMKVLGFELANVEHFFPMSVSKESLQKAEEGFKNVKDFETFKTGITSYIKETLPGTLKGRVESTKPIYIEDAFMVLARNNMVISKYIGFAGKIDHMVNFLEGIKGHMVEVGLESDYLALQNYVGSFMNRDSGNQGDKWVRTMIGLYAVKALGFPNIKVPLKQLPSALSALPYLDQRAHKEMFKWTPSRLRALKEEMTEHNPYFADRFHNGIDGDFLASGNEKEALKFLNQKKSIKDYISAQGLMLPISSFDSAVIANIWSATKKDIELNNPDIEVGSQEYWDLVSAKSQQIVRWTQPTFDAHTRTEAQKKLIMKPLTFFSTQRTKYLQQFERGVSLMLNKNATKEQHNQGVMILANIMLVNTMFMATLDWGWLILRGKLDDEEKRRQSLIMNIIRSGFGIFPVIDKLVGMSTYAIEGGRISQDAPGFDILVDFSEFVASWFAKEKRNSRRKKKSKGQKIAKEGMDVISNFGIPTQSAKGLIEVYNNLAEELEKR